MIYEQIDQRDNQKFIIILICTFSIINIFMFIFCLINVK